MSTKGDLARAALLELQSDVTKLRTACMGAFFQSDVDVCQGVADAAQAFISKTAPPLLVRIDAGDQSVALRFRDAALKIRQAVDDEGATIGAQLSSSALFARFYDEVIKQTATDVAQGAKDAAKVGLPLFALGGGAVLALIVWSKLK